MLKLYKLKAHSHKIGKSFRFDFPFGGDECVVGAFAILKETTPYPVRWAKLSISSDGQVVAPSINIHIGKPLKSTAKSLMIPIDHNKLGNKLTFVIEEYIKDNINYSTDEEKFMIDFEYELEVYVKIRKRK